MLTAEIPPYRHFKAQEELVTIIGTSISLVAVLNEETKRYCESKSNKNDEVLNRMLCCRDEVS